MRLSLKFTNFAPEMKLLSAPLQGLTEAPFCLAHAAIYGPADEYYTPFIRVEKGQVRPRDIANLRRCQGHIVPQLIFRDVAELTLLLDAIRPLGLARIDLNLGCPFPPQVKAGRGAALLQKPHILKEAAPLLSDLHVSIKMRLGIDSPTDWTTLLPALDALNPVHVTLHPRTARQQYRGNIDIDQFRAFIANANFPVVYNGDIHTPDDIARLNDCFPTLAGVMAGRGLLARPSLFAEYRTGQEWPQDRQLQTLRRLHDHILADYRQRLCGDTQILAKIQPFWTYPELLIGRKRLKALSKARTLDAYLSLLP